MRHTIILIALLCAACSSAVPSLKPYRMDIQQGNIVTSKMLLQLRPGMTQSQVKYIMGTPLIQDSFHKNRWDYFYQYHKDGKVVARRRVVLEFENGNLKHVRGDTIPPGPDPTVPEQRVMPQEPEKGLWDRLKFWKRDDELPVVPAQKPQETVAPGSEQIDPNLVNPPPSAPAPAITYEKPQAPEAEMPAVERRPAPVVTPESQLPAPSAAQPRAEPPTLHEGARPAERSQPVTPASGSKTSSNGSPTANKPDSRSDQESDDLPAEEDPSYFERMLEKIGF